MNIRLAAWIALIAFAAAIAGVVIGRHYLPRAHVQESALHQLLHDRLALDANQNRRLHAIEAEFAARRRALEQEMRAENRRLADAIAIEHGIGPRVSQAVDDSHRTMGELQKETLAHIFAMRSILRPDQIDKFDAAVTKALTEDPQ